MKHGNDYTFSRFHNGHKLMKAPQFVREVCSYCGEMLSEKGKIGRCRKPRKLKPK